MTLPTEPYPGAATDFRRAASLMTHFLRSDHDGITEILREAEADERETATFWLIIATLDLGHTFSPALQRDDAPDLLAQLIAQCMKYDAIDD